MAVGRGSRFLGRSADDDGLAVALSDALSAKDLAPCLRCGKRCFGAGRYHPGLELGYTSSTSIERRGLTWTAAASLVLYRASRREADCN